MAAKQAKTAKAAWKVFDALATTAAKAAAPRVASTAYRVISGRSAPANVRHPEVSAREAILWAIVSSGLAEAIRIAIGRGAVRYWQKSTGELPPGMK